MNVGGRDVGGGGGGCGDEDGTADSTVVDGLFGPRGRRFFHLGDEDGGGVEMGAGGSKGVWAASGLEATRLLSGGGGGGGGGDAARLCVLCVTVVGGDSDRRGGRKAGGPNMDEVWLPGLDCADDSASK